MSESRGNSFCSSVRTSIFRDRKPIPSSISKCLLRRRCDPKTQYYFTNRLHAVAGKPALQKLHPFYTLGLDKLLYQTKHDQRKHNIQEKQRRKLPVRLKFNKRFTATRDLSKRLYVEECSENIHTVVDIHPQYYSVVEGRPLRIPDDIKVYINNIRECAMFRQQIGYRYDIILNKDRSINKEKEAYEDIHKIFNKHIHDFQRFLSEDYKITLEMIAKSEKITEELAEANCTLLDSMHSISALNNSIFQIDSVRNIYKVFRKFLLFVAPYHWREIYDESLMGQGRLVIKSKVFSPEDSDLVESFDIDKVVETAKYELEDPLPAHIYFKNSEEMQKLFRKMELQSRDYLIQNAAFSTYLQQVRSQVKEYEVAVQMELNHFQYNINHFASEINRLTCNEAFLQKRVNQILENTFYETIAGPDALKLKICIEFVFDKIFGPIGKPDNIYETMKTLERFHEEYNLRIDTLDINIVRQAYKQNFSNDLRIMNKAVSAQKELKSANKFSETIRKSFLPPAKYKRLRMKKADHLNVEGGDTKAKSRCKKGPAKISEAAKLTTKEREFLLLFTDWTEGMNPLTYLEDCPKLHN